ncbi:MAG: hypothetical protein AB7S26_08090 [Sandaracinaceae bacterium]
MRISVVKGDKTDRVYIMRTDGTEASWSFPSYGPRGMPHDLVHLAIERALGMSDGIYASVAAGADLARINRAANRAGGTVRERYAALGGDVEGVMRSEALAAAPWLDESLTTEALGARVRELCGDFGVEPPDIDLAKVRDAVRAARAAWSSVGVGRALEATWP